MGLTAVVENLRALKKTVKKPIVAFRETVHKAYTEAYVGSPERVDEFYNYIKVYQPSKHNDLCMMSITADINRFSMLPDKHTFFHVHKLERHFDRMIAARKQPGVNGDMAIQILSGHNTTFMARYRRYKTRAAMKEAKRNEKRHMALNVKRHTQLPQGNGEAPDTVYPDAPGVPVAKVAPVASKTVATCEEVKDDEDDKVLAEISQAIKDVVLACELTKPETVVAAHTRNPAASESLVVPNWPNLNEDNNAYHPTKRVVPKKPAIILKTFPMVDKNKFKVAKPIKKEEKKEREVMKKEKKSVELLENVMVDLSLEQKTQSKELQGPSEVPTAVATKTIQLEDSGSESDSSEFDNLDSDSDGSDIEELEKIEEKDVDDLEYEMI